MKKAVIETRPRSPGSRKSQSLTEFVKKFCLSSSLHGLKFVGDPRLHGLERLFWGCMFLSGFSFSLYLCILVYQKWDDSPVTISMDSITEPVSNKDFPAVVICNNNKVRALDFRNYLSQLKAAANASDEFESDVREMVIAMSYVESSANANKKKIQYWADLMDRYQIASETLLDVLDSMKPKLEDQFLFCRFNNNMHNCSRLFKQVPTDEGACWKFSFKFRALTRDKFTGGIETGLTMLLYVDRMNYGISSHGYDGFKVLIQKDETFGEVGSRGFPVGYGSEVFASVRLLTMDTSQAVLTTPREKRRCILDGTLKYFSKYSHNNCVLECQLDLMLSRCDCLPYYHKFYNPDARTCSIGKYTCLHEARQLVLQESGTSVCMDCLPRCTFHWYSVSTSYAPYPGFGFTSSAAGMALNAEMPDLNKSELSVLHVFFHDRTSTRYKRDVRYGWEDFVSAMGGVLGLGIGFSLMSCVEFFYFITMRWYFELRGYPVHVNPVNKVTLAPVLPLWLSHREKCFF